MANTTFSFFSYGLQAGNQAPVAMVSPIQHSAVIGSIVKFDARSSYDPEGADLTYAWTFLEVPIGSEANNDSFEDLDDDGGAVAFTPDIVGMYRLQVVVNDGQFDSVPAETSVLVSAALMPTCTDVTPDARFLLRTISDFWPRHFQQSDVLPIIWSAYMQVAASELQRLLETDHNKSIQHIQDQVARRWLAYEPRIDLTPAQTYFIQGNEQEGLDAATGPFSETIRAIVISASEIRVIEGVARPTAAGVEVEVVSSNGVPGNRGTYTIRGVARGLSGYTLSRATPLPAPADDVIASSNDLVTNAGFDIVQSSGTNFAALSGFEAGDVLRISEGADRGFYEITGIGLADGLPDDGSLRLARSLTTSNSGLQFTVYNTVEVTVPEGESAFTDLLQVPADTSDLPALAPAPMTGKATVKSATEIVVGASKTFESAAGRAIVILDGDNAGRYVIADLNDPRTGYIVDRPFVGPFPMDDVSFRIDAVGAIAGRVIVVDDRAYTMLDAYETDELPATPTGPGEVGLAVLDRAMAPSKLSGLTWRVPATLVSEEIDFEELGVSAGDRLEGVVRRVDNGAVADFYGTVVGVDRNRLGFEPTLDPIVGGEPADASVTEKVTLAEALGMTGVAADVFGTLLLDGEGQEASDTLTSGSFNELYGNIPIRHTADIDIGPFSVNISVTAVVRNSQIAVDPRVISIPCLREYVRPPTVQDTGTELILLTRDGERTELDQLPVTLLENRDYTVDDESGFLCRDGEFQASTSTLESPTAEFLRKRVRSGDEVEVEHGPNAGTWVVQQVQSNTAVLLKFEATGDTVFSDEVNVEFTATRRGAGRFVRFDDDLWTANEPAPSRLWAETTFIDNAPVVESNFGVAVALTVEQLSERETRSVTYKHAVEGLLYAFANGPSLYNIAVGAHILLGLPVAVARGVIVDINDVYSLKPDGTPEFGRVLVEDVDAHTDEPLGIVRTYLYPAPPTVGADELTGIAENPDTGVQYAVGDIVDRFTPLSRGVDVQDYLTDPTWWMGLQSQGQQAELRKFHTWRMRANAQAVGPEDFAVAVEFANAIKPAWTELDAVLRLYLADVVEVTDTLGFVHHPNFYDSPSLSIAATPMMDDWSGRSLPLHLEDVGALSCRVLFSGDDLAMQAGSVQATSARGGFTGLVTTQVPSRFFSEALDTYTGGDMVKVGDVLYLPDAGPNQGWYAIIGVASGALELDDIQVRTPHLPGPTMAGIQDGEDLNFVIGRIVENPLDAGGTAMGTAATSMVELDTDSLYPDGVTTDDELLTFPFVGTPRRFIILEMQEPAPGQYWREVKVYPPPPDGNLGAWRIVRRYLDGPITGMTCSCNAGSPTVVIDEETAVRAERTDLRRTQLSATLRILEGPNTGEYEILDGFPNVSEVYVSPTPPQNSAGDSCEIVFDTPGGPHAWDREALVCPESTVRFTIYRPRVEVYAVNNLEVLHTDYYQFNESSILGFDTVPVLPGDFVDVLDGVNSGIYEILNLGPHWLEVRANLQFQPANVQARILRDSPDFNVVNDHVDVPAAVDLEVLGVQRGDLFEVFGSGGTVAVVASLDGPHAFWLTRDIGALGAVTGRVLREDIG